MAGGEPVRFITYYMNIIVGDILRYKFFGSLFFKRKEMREDKLAENHLQYALNLAHRFCEQ